MLTMLPMLAAEDTVVKGVEVRVDASDGFLDPDGFLE